MNNNLSHKKKKILEESNLDLRHNEDTKEIEKKKKISLGEIEESFYQYRKRIHIIILTYILLYASWCFIGHTATWLSKNSSIELLKSNQRFLHWTLQIVINLIIGLLFCLDGKICAWIKTPFARLTLGIGTSNLTKEKKQSLLFIATDANESLRETFKKFGMITIISEVQNFFFLGKNLGKFLREKNGCTANVEGVGDERTIEESYAYFCFLIAYLMPIGLSLYYIKKIKNSLEELKKEERLELEGLKSICP